MATRKKDLIDNQEEQAIIQQADRYGRKDATLNMRVSSQLLEEIKAAAAAEGVDKYQSWITMVLQCEVAKVNKEI